MNKKKLFKDMIQSRGKNFLFSDFVILLEAFGFRLDRINGSHHIYIHKQSGRLISVQCDGKDAKPYQVKQFIILIERLNLKLEDQS